MKQKTQLFGQDMTNNMSFQRSTLTKTCIENDPVKYANDNMEKYQNMYILNLETKGTEEKWCHIKTGLDLDGK